MILLMRTLLNVYIYVHICTHFYLFWLVPLMDLERISDERPTVLSQHRRVTISLVPFFHVTMSLWKRSPFSSLTYLQLSGNKFKWESRNRILRYILQQKSSNKSKMSSSRFLKFSAFTFHRKLLVLIESIPNIIFFTLKFFKLRWSKKLFNLMPHKNAFFIFCYTESRNFFRYLSANPFLYMVFTKFSTRPSLMFQGEMIVLWAFATGGGGLYITFSRLKRCFLRPISLDVVQNYCLPSDRQRKQKYFIYPSCKSIHRYYLQVSTDLPATFIVFNHLKKLS